MQLLSGICSTKPYLLLDNLESLAQCGHLKQLAINSQQSDLLELSDPIVESLRHVAEAVSHHETRVSSLHAWSRRFGLV